MSSDPGRVFISYSHNDLAWAEKLAASLAAQGFSLFFDKESLRAGQNWENQILGSLTDCAHLVVLWSKDSKASDWVQREIGFFDRGRYRGKQRIPGRQLIHVLLDVSEFAYESDQAVTDINDENAYAAGAAGVSGALWRRIMERTSEGLRGDSSVPVSRAIVTVEKKYVTGVGVPDEDIDRCVSFNYRPVAGRTLSELLGDMGVTRAQVEACYQDSREEWRPFGGNQTIREILDDVRDQLNRVPGADPIRWVPVEDKLFSNKQNEIDYASRRLASGLSLIVLDPIALYSRWMSDLVNRLLDGCLLNPNAIIVVLPLFPTPPQPRAHNDMIKQVYKRLVDYFYEERSDVEHAQCSIFTPDEPDIRRMVRARLRHSGRSAQESNPILTGRT